MQDYEAKPGRSELLKDMLEASGGDTETAGLYTKIRAMVTEVTRVSPLRLSNTLNSVANKTATELCYRSAEYILKRIETRSGLQPDEILTVEQETTDLFGEFLSELKTELMREFVEIENYIFNETYIVDPELFSGGFIRFAHHEGIDYTQPDNAHELVSKAEAAENEVEASLREVRRIRADIQDIDEVLPRIDELIEWLDATLASGIDDQAPQIRLIADEVESGINALRQQL